mgnify:FL=1
MNWARKVGQKTSGEPIHNDTLFYLLIVLSINFRQRLVPHLQTQEGVFIFSAAT